MANKKNIELDSMNRKKSPLINDITISLRLPKELHENIKNRASINNLTTSEFIRQRIKLFKL